MRKSVDLSIQFRENGQDGCVSVTIDFISNHVIKTHAELNRELLDFLALWKEISDKRSQLAAMTAEGANLSGPEVASLSQDILSATEKMTMTRYQTFPERRIDLIRKILQDNKCIDERLLSPEFWDTCVDPGDISEFLDQAVSKDVGKKKPNMMKQLYTTTV